MGILNGSRTVRICRINEAEALGIVSKTSSTSLVLENLRQFIARAQNGNPVNTLTEFIGIVINKTERLIIVQGAMILYVPHNHLSSVSRPID